MTPKDAAIGRIDSRCHVGGSHIHAPAVDDRPRLKTACVPDLKRARCLQAGNVFRADLIERDIARAGVVMRVIEPIACSRAGGIEFLLGRTGIWRRGGARSPNEGGRLVRRDAASRVRADP